jgi:hypothetical protein
MDLADHLALQDGLVSRTQALACGLTQTEIARLLRRRDLVAVHPGVYVNHTGPLTWQQRAWAAVLAVGPPAALCLDSALRSHEGPGRRTSRTDAIIDVAIPHGRHRVAPAGVRLHQRAALTSRVEWNRSPPRTRYDDTVLDLAARASALDAVGYLADACGSRRTTAGRLRAALDQRRRIPQRAWLSDILNDVAQGTCSVLEHGYLDLIERPHGLPVGDRQPPRVGGNGHVYRDVDLPDFGVIIELDGKLFHTATDDRDRDLERDLDAAMTGVRTTIRLGFGQVYARPCATAAKVGAVLRANGWTGTPSTCRSCASAA